MLINDPAEKLNARNQFLRQLWRESFTEAPKRSKFYQGEVGNVIPMTKYDFGFSYLGFYHPDNLDHLKNVPVRTFQTLFNVLDADNILYCKPNTYWASNGMQEEHLRFLNAFVVDIDFDQIESKYLADFETYILDQCERNGLPLPTVINRTPSGGYHVWFLFDSKVPIPAKRYKAKNGQDYSKVISLYNVIHRRLLDTLGGDQHCTSAAQYYRIPRDITYYDPNNLNSFSSFVSWLHELYPENDPASPEYFLKTMPKAIRRSSGKLMASAAGRELLKGFDDGCRNEGIYALACLLRMDNVPFEEGLNTCYETNQKSNPPKSESEVRRTVQSAYRKNKFPGKVIFELTGHKIIRYRREWVKNKKLRKDRVRNHLHEWTGDLFACLKKKGGSAVGSQVKLSSFSGIPLSTFKKLLKALKEKENSPFVIDVSGRGCAAETAIHIKEIDHGPVIKIKLNRGRIWADLSILPAASGFSQACSASENDAGGRDGPS